MPKLPAQLRYALGISTRPVPLSNDELTAIYSLAQRYPLGELFAPEIVGGLMLDALGGSPGKWKSAKDYFATNFIYGNEDIAILDASVKTRIAAAKAVAAPAVAAFTPPPAPNTHPGLYALGAELDDALATVPPLRELYKVAPNLGDNYVDARPAITPIWETIDLGAHPPIGVPNTPVIRRFPEQNDQVLYLNYNAPETRGTRCYGRIDGVSHDRRIIGTDGMTACSTVILYSQAGDAVSVFLVHVPGSSPSGEGVEECAGWISERDPASIFGLLAFNANYTTHANLSQLLEYLGAQQVPYGNVTLYEGFSGNLTIGMGTDGIWGEIPDIAGRYQDEY